MERFLNRGLNFSILPKKMDLTKVYVDFKRFKRSAIWTEFFFGRNTEDTKTPIFKTTKTNLPKNYQVPDGLKKFLASVESEIQDPRNRNSVDCNIPDDEIEALKELVRLQKERKIVIKECDKGAGIIILTYEEYMKACYNHLTSEQQPGHSYYSPVSALEVEATKDKIDSI